MICVFFFLLLLLIEGRKNSTQLRLTPKSNKYSEFNAVFFFYQNVLLMSICMRCCDKTTARWSCVLACRLLFDTKEKKQNKPPTLLLSDFTGRPHVGIQIKVHLSGSSDKGSVPWRLDCGTTSAGIVCSVHLLPVTVSPSAWPHFVVAVFCDDAF